jgi:RNA polymerase sigma-70 factor (ECF subfamily)
MHVPDELVALAQQGDREAVGLVLATVRPPVVRYCRSRLIGSALSADDLAQEICLTILTTLPRYRPGPFLPFVYGIAAHQVGRALRTAARRRSEPVADPPDTAAPAEGPEQHVLADRLDRMLATLPRKQREILLLRVVLGLSAEETATALRSTPGAVRVAQHRALTRLRRTLPTTQPVPTLPAGPTR